MSMQSSTVAGIGIHQLHGAGLERRIRRTRGVPIQLARRFETNAAGNGDQILQGVVEIIVDN